MLTCIVALVCAGCASVAPHIALDGDGGEAWAFAKRVEGSVAAGACDEIVVAGESGAAKAIVAGMKFFAAAPLREGANGLRAECRRSGRVIARSDEQRWTLKLPDRPRAQVRVRAADSYVHLDAGASQPAPGAPAPLVRFQWFARATNPAPLVLAGDGGPLDGREGSEMRIAAPQIDGEYYVTLRATDALERNDESTAVFRVRGGELEEVDLTREHPAWVDEAIVYGAAPFFFSPARFDGVRERLDEIAALGATVIWLSPITTAAPDDFGYAVADHFKVRAAFGGEASLRRLIERAHALGLRVILDFVPNHVSTAHRYYQNVARRGGESAYYDWFDRDAAGEITYYFDWSRLRNLEYDNPEVQNHIIAAFSYWVREVGVDGYRVDATWGVRERAPEFWPRWRAELKRIDPDLFLLAEASARDPYYAAHGFDAAYDWTDRLGEWAWRDVFVDGRVDLARLRAALTSEGRGFPPDTLTFRFLNNNDTGTRFITRHGAPLTKLAATLLFTLPGAPLIYNGDEVGAEFEPYDEGPPIDWSDPHGLTPHYAQLSRLRRSRPALRGRSLELLRTSADQTVLAYRRPAGSPREDVIVVLNFGAEERFVEIDGIERSAGEVDPYVDLLSGRRIDVRAARPGVRLGPHEALVLSRAPLGSDG